MTTEYDSGIPQVQELAENHRHWLNEIDNAERTALALLDTFNNSIGVNIGRLEQAKEEVRHGYLTARFAVVYNTYTPKGH
jgi:hypothetical protein